MIRPAQASDTEALRAIYNDAVANTTATMDTEARSPDAQTAWMTAHDGFPYPCLVAQAVEIGDVVGYATLSAYIPRPGYQATAETSVYVHCNWQGLGIGGALLSALINEAARRGFVSLVALISSDNEASLRLHARQGFISAGTLRRVGRKFGVWVDVTFMQKLLDETPASLAD